ncbi:MAG: sigma-70 family RNA polymerase sigma factor [Bacteroidetes bacterium]|nr:sigma-70 family RNA polymerase sigma factor [Bacteroidota bacterium]
MLKIFRRNITEKSDEELVLAYRADGDLEVLGALYERYVELVYGVCLQFFKDSGKAEDAVMALFETLVEKVKTQDIRQFRPWLHVVAKNHCLMQLRRKNFTVSFDEMPPAMQADVVHSSGVLHPSDVFEENGEQQALKKCIEKLSPQQKHCVEQFYMEEKSYKEIADMTGEALGLVRSNIQNGRRNLRICMENSLTVDDGRRTIDG